MHAIPAACLALIRRLAAPLALILAVATTPLIAPPARADIAAGWRALGAGDYGSAEEEWRPLAERGDPGAQLAMAFLADLLDRKTEALDWYRKAAEQDETAAQVLLGSKYAQGDGVPVNLARAYYWFDRAAALGHPKAAQMRDALAQRMTVEQLAAAKALANPERE